MIKYRRKLFIFPEKQINRAYLEDDEIEQRAPLALIRDGRVEIDLGGGATLNGE